MPAQFTDETGSQAEATTPARRPWWLGAAALSLLMFAMVAAIILSIGRASPQGAAAAIDVDHVMLKAEKGPSHPDFDCYTVNARDGGKPWGDCYKHVLWAKYHGIKTHPDWYVEPYRLEPHRLLDTSPLESFQYFIYHHKLHGWVCPQPCPTGTLKIYYKQTWRNDGMTGIVHPSLELKYGECTFDGDSGANMLVGNFAPWNVHHDVNYYAYVHHFNNVFCDGKADTKWFVYTDGDTAHQCCAANGTMCEAACSAAPTS